MDKQVRITFKDQPRLNGFSIRIPVGEYSGAQLLDLVMFEYQWQCDEAKTKTLVVGRIKD